MGRLEKQLDPTVNDCAAFAHDLRLLRDAAGRPTYRELAAKIHYSAAAISRALGGQTLPTLPLTMALVDVLAGDTDTWEQRWRRVSGNSAPDRPVGAPAPTPDHTAPDHITSDHTTPDQAVSEYTAHTDPLEFDDRSDVGGPRLRRRRRWWLLAVASGLVIVAVAVVMIGVTGNNGPAARAAQPAAAQPRHVWQFDRPDNRWWIFWGADLAETKIVPGFDNGRNAFLATISNAATPNYRTVGIGVDHDLTGLRPGMKVTARLWTPGPENGAVSFFAKNPRNEVKWMPEPKILLVEHSGWTTVTWTVPATVDRVFAIGMQVEEENNGPLLVAIDDVRW